LNEFYLLFLGNSTASLKLTTVIKNVQKLQTLEKEKNNLWQDCRVIQGHLSDTISKCKDQTKEALEQFMQEYLLYTSAKEELLANVENYCAKTASNQKSQFENLEKTSLLDRKTEVEKQILHSLQAIHKALQSESILENNILLANLQYSFEKLEEIISQLKHCQSNIHVLEREQKSLLQQLKMQQDSNSAMITAIQQIGHEIGLSGLSKCPVCQSEFDTTEQLQSRILTEYHNRAIDSINVKMMENSKELNSENEQKKILLAQWDTEYSAIENQHSRQLLALKKEREELNTVQESLMEDLTKLALEKNALLEKLNSFAPYNQDLTPRDFQSWYVTQQEKYEHEKDLLLQFQSFFDLLGNISMQLPSEQLVNILRANLQNYSISPPNAVPSLEQIKSLCDKFQENWDAISVLEKELSSLQPYDATELKKLEEERRQASEKLDVLDQTILSDYSKLLSEYFSSDEVLEEHIREDLLQKENELTISQDIAADLDGLLGSRDTIDRFQNSYLIYMAQKNTCEQEVDRYKKALSTADLLCEKMKMQQELIIDHAFSGTLANHLYQMLEPCKEFQRIKFEVDANQDKAELYLRAEQSKDSSDVRVLPELIFSTAQLNTISLSIFLSNNLSCAETERPVRSMILDDPISSFDDINTVAFADLLRILCSQQHWQILFTTHDEQLFQLLQVKLPAAYHNSCFMKFVQKGELILISAT